eukprot:m.99912 g.99912  ORF g.99912 m.99912 type:complete len:206 (+) comp9035_c0_seq1:34-651(+)
MVFVTVTASPSTPPTTSLCTIASLQASGASIVLKQYWSSSLPAPPATFAQTSGTDTTTGDVIVTLVWGDVQEPQTVVNAASSTKIYGDGNCARLLVRLTNNTSLYPSNNDTTAKVDDALDVAASFAGLSSKETKNALKALNQSIDKASKFYVGDSATLADFALWGALLNSSASLPSNIKAWKKAFDDDTVATEVAAIVASVTTSA